MMRYKTKEPSSSEIYEAIGVKFKHPGVTLFRGRELDVLVKYFTRKPIPASVKLLDLGCGEGDVASILFNRVNTGIDILPEEIRKAKKRKIYDNLIIADAKKLSFKNGEFDYVFSNSVIEHIPGIEEVIAEVGRVTRKGGSFIFTSPSRYFTDYLYISKILRKIGLTFLAKSYAKLRNSKLNHFNLFDHREWSRRLKKEGLKVIYYEYYLPRNEIEIWDKICLFLKLSQPFSFLNNSLKQRYDREVKMILRKREVINSGGSLLVVANKIK